MTLFDKILEERARQDAQWGGSEHDDGHTHADWVRFIAKHAGRATGTYDFRGQMVRVAALAVAALEAEDRKAAEEMEVWHTPVMMAFAQRLEKLEKGLAAAERYFDQRSDGILKRVDGLEERGVFFGERLGSMRRRIDVLEIPLRQAGALDSKSVDTLEEERGVSFGERLAVKIDNVSVATAASIGCEHEWGSPQYLVRRNWGCCFTPYSVVGFRIICKKCSTWIDQFTGDHKKGGEYVAVDSQTGKELE